MKKIDVRELRTLAVRTGIPMLLCIGLCTAGADELAVKGREVFAKYQRAVVPVQVVLKASSGGSSRENKQEVTGTVIDPSGLTVLALSACDPTELYRRLSVDSKLEVEVSDVKILLEGGAELPAEIVLRDKDLDLAFVRPKINPSAPMSSIDLTNSGTAQVLDQLIALNRLNKAANRAYAASAERISGVVQKPRTFYIPDSSLTTTTVGSPAFLPDGKLVGIFVMRAVNASGGDVRQSYTTIILPAEDVLNAAKQAPAHGEEAKKEPATAAAGSTNAEPATTR